MIFLPTKAQFEMRELSIGSLEHRLDPALHKIEIGLCDETGGELDMPVYKRTLVVDGIDHAELPSPFLAFGWMLFSDDVHMFTAMFSEPTSDSGSVQIQSIKWEP
jgi:hypothetical protein